MDISETIAASGLKIMQTTNSVNESEDLRSRSFLALGPRSFTFEY